jgi:FkbM family methyltransferase
MDGYILYEQARNVRKLDLAKSDVVLDVGAHIGTFAITIHDLVNTVHCFEPDISNYSLLVDNLCINKIGNIRAYNVAVVANLDKERMLFSKQGEHQANTLIARKGYEHNKVKCTNINEIMEQIKPTVVKLDCEGAEAEIIPKVATWDTVRTLIFEWHFGVLKGLKIEPTIELLRKSFPLIHYNKPDRVNNTVVVATKNDKHTVLRWI